MTRRTEAIGRIAEQHVDVLVIGGGINGAISALAASAHGASVALVDRADFASGTSQESSNLVWGGFKYLEGYEIGLVHDLCRSRNELAAAYPSRIAEVRFLATLDRSAPYRPTFAALGAHAYWGLGNLRTARPRRRTRARIAELEPAVELAGARGGIEYSDCLLLDNDARFVSEAAIAAAGHGAAVANYVEVLGAERAAGSWRLELLDVPTATRYEVSASSIVNAAGAWAPDVGAMAGTTTRHRVVLSKGVHLVVPQVTASGRVLAFYDDTQRLFYVIPMGHRSVIGTTDDMVGDPGVGVDDRDRAYVLEQVNKRLRLERPLVAGDVLAERCGVRTLVLDTDEQVGDRDWTALSRKHAVEVDAERRVVSVLGGKLSDCLNVGSEVVRALGACGVALHPPATRWFGEPGPAERERYLRTCAGLGLDRPPRFDPAASVAELLWRRHGDRAVAVAERIREDPTLGEPVMDLADHCRAELEVAAEHEWIVTMDDFLRRRTQLAQLHRTEALLDDPGVAEAGRVLLPDEAVDDWIRAQAPRDGSLPAAGS